MTATALLLAVAMGAGAPCAHPEADARALAQEARAPERFATELARLEAELDAPLLRPGEANLEPVDQARAAGERLKAICALRAQPAPAVDAPDRARLKEILDRPEFAEARSRGDEVLLRWVRRLREWLDELFQTREAQSYSEVTRTAVLGLAIAGVVAVALRARGRSQERARRQAPEVMAENALALDAPEEHLARARAALAVDAREAIREGLLGLLSGLERRRLARPDRVKTNRELAAELPARGASAELTARVAELLRWYDRSFYSLEPVPAAEARRFVESVGQLEASLGGAP